MGLTPHQKIVFDQIWAFIKDDKSKVFILTGYAGTGKTFLLKELGSRLKQEKIDFSLLASTGRAASVLREKTEFESKTIHSELYLFSEVEGDNKEIPVDASIDQYGQMRLIFTIRKGDNNNKKIYIVDESSMISDVDTSTTSYARFGSGRLLFDLMKTVGNNKVVFTGDPCQLPPVSQEYSPSLSAGWFNKYNYNVVVSSLTEIIRHNESSGILTLATKVRSLLDKPINTRWVKLQARNTPNVKIVDVESLKDILAKTLEMEGYDNCIAISYSNNNCHYLNSFIRKKRYKKINPELQKGDILMITQNNILVRLVNGDFVEVLSIGETFDHVGFKFGRLKVKAIHNQMEYNVLLCYDTLSQSKGNLSMDQQKMLMIDFRQRMKIKGINPKDPYYSYELRNDEYLNSLRASFGYAVTCHKSQGGEWDNVFLFLNKGMYHMGAYTLIKWWYTAITRAKKTLYITDGWWIK